VAGLAHLVPGYMADCGSGHHPCQEQLADFMKGHAPNEGFRRGVVIV
jgi:hypothetical protein